MRGIGTQRRGVYASSCRGQAEVDHEGYVVPSHVIFMALVAGFPWQTPAQTPCPRASQCVPDGVLTITFSVSGDTSDCVFTATVNWGDGLITNVSHIVDGQTMTHTYTQRASTRSTSRDQGRRPALIPSARSTQIPSSPYRPTFKREVSPCTYPALPRISPSTNPDHLYAGYARSVYCIHALSEVRATLPWRMSIVRDICQGRHCDGTTFHGTCLRGL